MEHNACKSCGGASETPGVCETPGCNKNGQPLESCNCEDNKHGMEGGSTEEPKTEAPAPDAGSMPESGGEGGESEGSGEQPAA